MTELVECVPNFSEGRDLETFRALESAVRSVERARLVDSSLDADHHRAVLTFGGEGDAVVDAALAALDVAVERIDLSHHVGVHPRIGALDVCPFVALAATPQRVQALAREFGGRAAERHDLPVFFYGDVATRPERRALPALRPRGGRGLLEALGTDPAFAPDRGPNRPHPTAGAMAVGVREALIAYNVDLQTDDLALAKRIARELRESSGGLPGVRALGLALESRGLVQVSMNLVDWKRTGLVEVYEAVSQGARAGGVQVHSSELIGLAPAGALDDAVATRIRLRDYDPDRQILERRLRLDP